MLKLVLLVLFITLKLSDCCSCIPRTLQQHYNDADLAVEGRISSFAGKFYISVERIFKGNARIGDVIAVNNLKLTSCEVPLKAGESRVLFGTVNAKRQLTITLCNYFPKSREVSRADRKQLNKWAATWCPKKDLVQCLVNPCFYAKCGVRGAVCEPNYCGGCHAIWWKNGVRVCN